MVDEAQKASPKERGKRLRVVRKMSGLTLSELAQKYDLGISTIKYWECAKSQGLSSKGAKKIIKAMQVQGIQCSYMWLMFGVGLPPQFREVHVHERGTDDISIDKNTYDEEKAIAQEMDLFCTKVIDAITVKVLDDGMEPVYSIGDGIGGRRLYVKDLARVIGKNCIVETVNKEVLCRRVAQGNGDSFNLYCINPYTAANPPHLYNIELLSAAPITRIWKRIILE